MDCETLLQALRRTACDNLRCLGCGHEHNCSLHGCAINRAAAEMIEEQAARITELEHPPNDPLTLEELREMDGEPVWSSYYQCWGLISVCASGKWVGVPFSSLRRTDAGTRRMLSKDG